MADIPKSSENKRPRILILSQRGLCDHVAHSCLFEFEDVIADIDQVDFFTPQNSYDFSKSVFTWVKRFTRSPKVANAVRPDPNPIYLEKEYDLLYVLLAEPFEILALDSIKNWREKCKFAVCHLVEIWEGDLTRWSSVLKLYQDFDHLFFGHYFVVDPISKFLGIPCSYLPMTVDALKFCPYPHLPQRNIDINYIGRQSAITHAALLNLAEQRDLFYFYDTTRIFYVKSYSDHRRLFANLLKRSTFFIANRARANCPELRGTQSEIGYRFFEGAAAGTVMLGDYPRTDVFNQYFDWEDAVIPLPFDAPDIADTLDMLNAQPERLAMIRKNGVRNGLLRYDWAYSWEKILQAAGLEPTEKLLLRKAYLKAMAEKID